jgi:hypothetical protein
MLLNSQGPMPLKNDTPTAFIRCRQNTEISCEGRATNLTKARTSSAASRCSTVLPANK